MQGYFVKKASKNTLIGFGVPEKLAGILATTGGMIVAIKTLDFPGAKAMIAEEFLDAVDFDVPDPGSGETPAHIPTANGTVRFGGYINNDTYVDGAGWTLVRAGDEWVNTWK